MLKELNKRCLNARRQKGAWERWHRKAPHNRPQAAEPPIDPRFCRKVTLPSGHLAVLLDGAKVEEAYRQARYPKPAEGEVEHLAISEEEVRRLHAQVG
jgi:hypothetical protein